MINNSISKPKLHIITKKKDRTYRFYTSNLLKSYHFSKILIIVGLHYFQNILKNWCQNCIVTYHRASKATRVVNGTAADDPFTHNAKFKMKNTPNTML